MTQLKPGTIRLLQKMHSRREKLLSHQGEDGWWRFVKKRVRSARDYLRIAEFPRCPKPQKDRAMAVVNDLIWRSRRYEERNERA